jgi:hypothetical protein
LNVTVLVAALAAPTPVSTAAVEPSVTSKSRNAFLRIHNMKSPLFESQTPRPNAAGTFYDRGGRRVKRREPFLKPSWRH